MAQARTASKVFVVVLVALTLGIAGTWIGINLAHTDEMAVGISKDYAKEFEEVCRSKGLAKRPCKRVIGTHHIRCFAKARVDDDSTRQSGLLKYDKARYRTCIMPPIEALARGEDPGSLKLPGMPSPALPDKQ